MKEEVGGVEEDEPLPSVITMADRTGSLQVPTYNSSSGTPPKSSSSKKKLRKKGPAKFFNSEDSEDSEELE